MPSTMYLCCAIDDYKTRTYVRWLLRGKQPYYLQSCPRHSSTTPLHLAVKENYPDVVQTLIKKHPRIVDRKDAKSRTALQLAIRRREARLVRILLQRADVHLFEDSPSGNYVTQAVRNFTLSCAQWIIKAGGDVNGGASSRHHTPLKRAMIIQWDHLAEMLLRSGGCDVEMVIQGPASPEDNIMQYATKYNAEDCFIKFLEYGCDIYSYDTMLAFLKRTIEECLMIAACALLAINPKLLEDEWCVKGHSFMYIVKHRCVQKNTDPASKHGIAPIVTFLQRRIQSFQRHGYQPHSLATLCRVPVLRVLSRQARAQHKSISQVIDDARLSHLKPDLDIPSYNRVQKLYLEQPQKLFFNML
jgi:hypothetical protein